MADNSHIQCGSRGRYSCTATKDTSAICAQLQFRHTALQCDQVSIVYTYGGVHAAAFLVVPIYRVDRSTWCFSVLPRTEPHSHPCDMSFELALL